MLSLVNRVNRTIQSRAGADSPAESEEDMKCLEIFYRKWEAEKFAEQLQNVDWKADAKIVETIDEDVDEKCWLVYYNPKPLRKHR